MRDWGSGSGTREGGARVRGNYGDSGLGAGRKSERLGADISRRARRPLGQEVWTDEAAHRASLQIPAVREPIRRGMPLIATFGDAKVTAPVGGVGLAL
jgi:hypothetical protein